MRDNERDALVAKLNRVATSMVRDDEAAVWWIKDVREVAEALAAPAEGGQDWRIGMFDRWNARAKQLGFNGIAEAIDRTNALASAPSADNRPFGALTDLYNSDSAGEAKCTGADCKPRDGGTLCQSCGGDITPQPADGDGAVYQWHEFAGRWEDFTKEQFDEVQSSGEIVLGETIITPAMTRKLYTHPAATPTEQGGKQEPQS